MKYQPTEELFLNEGITITKSVFDSEHSIWEFSSPLHHELAHHIMLNENCEFFTGIWCDSMHWNAVEVWCS